MGRKTFIQWCDDTVNATSGCDGCELKIKGRAGSCYAVPIHTGRLASAFPDLYSPDFHEVRLIPGRMRKAAEASDLTGKSRPGKPWLDGRPRIIFIGDLGDLFSRAVPFEYIRDEIFGAITSPRGRRHVWMILTKQPKRLADFAGWYEDRTGSTWPTNVMSGTSVTTQASVGRVEDLLEVPGRKFVSAEPMWGPINLSEAVWSMRPDRCRYFDNVPALEIDGKEYPARRLDLMICGGESRQGNNDPHPFNLAWARSLRDQCKAGRVPFFLKQLGANVHGYWLDPNGSGDGICYHSPDRGWELRDYHGGDWDEWPHDLRVRQFPEFEALTIGEKR